MNYCFNMHNVKRIIQIHLSNLHQVMVFSDLNKVILSMQHHLF